MARGVSRFARLARDNSGVSKAVPVCSRDAASTSEPQRMSREGTALWYYSMLVVSRRMTYWAPV